MPERTMSLMTEGQARKIISKLGGVFGNWPQFEAPLNELGPTIDRNLAQLIIENEYVPKPDGRAIVESIIRHYEQLRECIRKGVADEIRVAVQTNRLRGYSMMGPRSQEVHWKCSSFEFNLDGRWQRRNFDAPEVCRAVGVDPALIESIYLYYRPSPEKDVQANLFRMEFQDERLQLITDILPFPKLTWDFFMGEDWTGAQVFVKGDIAHDIADVRAKCALGKSLVRARVKARRRRNLVSR